MGCINKTLLVFACAFLTLSVCDDRTERLTAELQLDDLELADACESISVGKKNALLTSNFQDRLVAEENYGDMLKVHAETLRTFDDVPDELERNVTYQTKPGDGILPKTEWSNLVQFKNKMEEVANQVKIPCSNGTKGCFFSKTDYREVLRSSRNATELRDVWSAWQTIYNVSDVEKLSENLHLVQVAATLNGFETAKEYWEFLANYPGAYAMADELWEQLRPLYVKLHAFVKRRLLNYYRIKGDPPNIPAYLLGDRFGSDWSEVADIVLPHPQLHYDVESYLKFKNVKEIYRLAEHCVEGLSLGGLGDAFWQNSDFDAPVCGPEILEFYSQHYTEIRECNRSTWVTYLDAHETAVRVALNNKDYQSLPRLNLRYSAIDEALYSLGWLLAIESLQYHGIVEGGVSENSTGDESVQMTKLLLTAMRTLPGLPYYLAADVWRLQEIDGGAGNLTQNWWSCRLERVTSRIYKKRKK